MGRQIDSSAAWKILTRLLTFPCSGGSLALISYTHLYEEIGSGHYVPKHSYLRLIYEESPIPW
jgi:hypothetical protein